MDSRACGALLRRVGGWGRARADVRLAGALIVWSVLGTACDRSASSTNAPTTPVAGDDKQGGTGTRAQGGEGHMGAPATATAAASAVPTDGLEEKGTVGIGNGLIGLGAGGGGRGYAAAPQRAFGIPGAPPPAADDRDAPFQARHLDPNARYATTYRPGGAALAAFDAALDRGAIPVAYRDLVADFGGRYAPSIDVPEGSAMAFDVATERAAAAPEGGAMNLRIAMRSTEAMPARAPLSVHLVLDISGSMAGTAIANARTAAEQLVERLDPQDDFSMVTFSDEARVLVADGAVGPRRASILDKIEHVNANGGTNISAGLDMGYQQAHAPGISQDAVRIVMLLSDGHANAGDTNPQALAERSAKAFQDGIQTSSFGLGADFDAPLMSSFADRGAGGYYYLADSSQIAPALSREMDARLVPAALGVEVRVRLRPDVGATKVFGSRELTAMEAAQVRKQEVDVDKNAQKKDGIAQDRQTDAQGGMRFFMPAFARADRHAMMITLDLPPGAAGGERAIASVEIKYKDRIAKKNVTQEIPVRIRYAESEAQSADSVDEGVARAVQAFSAGDSILDAAWLVDRGDRAGAARVLTERADLLARASTQLDDPALGEDGKRLARLAGAVVGSGQVQDAVPLAVMLRGSAYGYLQ